MSEIYAIDVKGLSKKFGSKTIVDNVDIRVKKGQVCGFLGPNGSGKTTVMRMLCGLLKADAGDGRCLGLDFNANALAVRLQTGYMTQKFGWYEDLSVRENLEFVARLFALKDVKGATEKIMRELELSPRANQLAGGLSGGWKQRLALGMCLIHEPKLLLLDEPTAGVDPKARREFWDIIHAVAGRGATVLVSTHYMDEAQRCHELIYIAYGRILASGAQDRILKERALNVWTLSGADAATLLDAVKILKGRKFVKSIGAFSDGYRAITTDEAALKGEISRLNAKILSENLRGENSRITLTPTPATLEDVFIDLLENRKDERY